LRDWLPRLLGAAVPLLVPVLISTPEALAYGLAFVAVVLASKQRVLASAALFVVASLTRETAGLVALASALGLLVSGRGWRAILGVALPPLVAVGGWYLALGRLVGGRLPRELQVFGLLHAGAGAQAVASVILVVSLAGAWGWRRVPVAWPICLAFAALVLIQAPATLGLLDGPRLAAPAVGLGLAYLIASPPWIFSQTARPTASGSQGSAVSVSSEASLTALTPPSSLTSRLRRAGPSPGTSSRTDFVIRLPRS
jgi:hypothetical protein